MSNSVTVTGKVHHVGPTETFGQSGFQKRILVVNNGRQYSNLTPIEFTKDKCVLLDGLALGQEVTVHFNAGGREYNGRFYPQNDGWKLDKGQAVAAPAPVASGEVEDDLPF